MCEYCSKCVPEKQSALKSATILLFCDAVTFPEKLFYITEKICDVCINISQIRAYTDILSTAKHS